MAWFNVWLLLPSGVSKQHLTYVEEDDYSPWVLYEAVEEQAFEELALNSSPCEQCIISKASSPFETVHSYRFWEAPSNAKEVVRLMLKDPKGPVHCHDWIEALATSPYASQWIQQWHLVDPDSLNIALTLHDHTIYLDCLATAKSSEEKTRLWNIFSHHVDEIKKDPAALVEISLVHPDWKELDQLQRMQELRHALPVAQMLESPDIDHDVVPLFVQRQYFTKLASMIECMHDRPALPVSTLSWDF